MVVKVFMIQALGGCIIKHYGFVMYGLRSKLVCLAKPIKVTITDTSLTFNAHFPYIIN